MLFVSLLFSSLLKFKSSAKFCFIFVGFFFLVSSCTKDEFIEKEITNNPDLEISNPIVKDGMLSFSNIQSFNNYISNIKVLLEDNGGDYNRVQRNEKIITPDGFTPLISKLARVEEMVKNGAKSILDYEQICQAEIDQTLIPDEVLHYVVDEDRRILISGDIHHITEIGTFIYSEDNIATFESFCSEFFDAQHGFTARLSENTYQYGDITFVDSYNFLENGNLSEEFFISLVNGSNVAPTPEEENPRIIDEYTNSYKLINYQLGGHTIAGQAVASLGLNNWRSAYFDSDHRVNANLYSVDYGFFKSAGFKVKFQKREPVTITLNFFRWNKTITLYHIWKEKKAQDLVLGVDFFQGYTQLTDFGLENGNYINGVTSHSKNWSQMAAKMVFKGFLKSPLQYIENWVENIHIFGGAVEFLGNSYTENDIYKQLYKQAYGWLVDEFKRRTSGFVFNQTFNKNAPAMLVSPGVGSYSNREYLLLKGINSYPNISEKKVRYGYPSFGVTWTQNQDSWFPKPFTPNAFIIEEAYVFGAVKYNGVWKGVRIYKKKN